MADAVGHGGLDPLLELVDGVVDIRAFARGEGEAVVAQPGAPDEAGRERDQVVVFGGAQREIQVGDRLVEGLVPVPERFHLVLRDGLQFQGALLAAGVDGHLAEVGAGEHQVGEFVAVHVGEGEQGNLPGRIAVVQDVVEPGDEGRSRTFTCEGKKSHRHRQERSG